MKANQTNKARSLVGPLLSYSIMLIKNNAQLKIVTSWKKVAKICILVNWWESRTIALGPSVLDKTTRWATQLNSVSCVKQKTTWPNLITTQWLCLRTKLGHGSQSSLLSSVFSQLYRYVRVLIVYTNIWRISLISSGRESIWKVSSKRLLLPQKEVEGKQLWLRRIQTSLIWLRFQSHTPRVLRINELGDSPCLSAIMLLATRCPKQV